MGIIGQVTVLGDWMRNLVLRSDGWRHWSQRGSRGRRGRGGRKGRRGREGAAEGGGIFQVPGDLLFPTLEELEAYLREALEEGNGDDGEGEGGGADDKGDKGGDKRGDEGDEKGDEKGGGNEGNVGGENGATRCKEARRHPPPCKGGTMWVTTRESRARWLRG